MRSGDFILVSVCAVSAAFLCVCKSGEVDATAFQDAVRSKLGAILGLPEGFALSKRRHSRAIPDYMRSLFDTQYRMLYGEGANEIELTTGDYSMHHPLLTQGPVDTVRSFRHVDKSGDPRIDRRSYGEGRVRFRFNVSFSEFPSEERLLGAELRLYLHKRPSQPETIQVYDIVRPATKRQPDAILRLIDTKTLISKKLPKEAGIWIGLDATEAVQRWRSDPTENHGLYVKAFIESGNSTMISPSPSVMLRPPCSLEDPHNKTVAFHPTLLTFHSTRDVEFQASALPLLRRPRAVASSTSSAAHHRKSHHHRKKNLHRHKQQCKRHELFIDFSDVGWNDWIVAPNGYHAYYCAGECTFPIPEHLNGTNHAIVQSLVNSVRHRHGAPAPVPKSCCVPTELAPISMLYVDAYESVVLKNYQEMVVIGCGCR